ncbi:hypothetical protein NA78x_002108 [Anatilimnocola sp. NA78]|uniref:hypothetical protein n=1 Tax=Anatilimnocola sp. NA78 TaxID=3415683 RepID=UPI003CE5781E
MTGFSLKAVRAAKSEAAQVFSALVGDVAVGVMRLADDSYGLKINLASQPDKKVRLPSAIAGVPVKVEVVGRIKKRS